VPEPILCPLRTSVYQRGCSTVAVKPFEKTSTADLVTSDDRGVAGVCKALHTPISKPYSFLRLALRCTVLRSRWCQSGVNVTLIFAGHRRPRQPGRFDLWKKEGRCPGSPRPSMKQWSFRPRQPPRGLRLPRPSRCPLPPEPSCAFSPLGGGSRVFAVSWDYVETSLGTARPITQAVGKV
jgi:hypothetical protein